MSVRYLKKSWRKKKLFWFVVVAVVAVVVVVVFFKRFHLFVYFVLAF